MLKFDMRYAEACMAVAKRASAVAKFVEAKNATDYEAARLVELREWKEALKAQLVVFLRSLEGFQGANLIKDSLDHLEAMINDGDGMPPKIRAKLNMFVQGNAKWESAWLMEQDLAPDDELIYAAKSLTRRLMAMNGSRQKEAEAAAEGNNS